MPRLPPAPEPGPRPVSPSLPELAARLRVLPPSVGPVRLVAVDGYAGAGKTTLAAELAAALGRDPAPVVHLDDLATHEEFFDWTGRLEAGLLEPFRHGRPGRFPAYDWTARAFGPTRAVPCAPVVLLEGVGAGRRALRPFLSFVIWLDLDLPTARARGEQRDGPELAGFWREWVAQQSAHFARDPTRPFADLLVRRPDRAQHRYGQ